MDEQEVGRFWLETSVQDMVARSDLHCEYSDAGNVGMALAQVPLFWQQPPTYAATH